MKSRKSLKALIMSVLSLVVCMSLFVGSTFAWFTDSAVGKNQVIQSGNLDMVVTASTSGEESDYEVVENKELFSSTALWEPGHVEYAYVRVENNGSLAFEYSMEMSILSEEKGVNQQGQDFYLSNYIRYGIVAGKTIFSTGEAGRAEAIALVENTSTLLADTYFEDEIVLLGKGNTTNPNLYHDYTVVVYMPTSVGNEANHNGTVPSITFGMQFLATQYNYELDDFNGDYDKDAAYPVATAQELANALIQGDVVSLSNDIVVDAPLDVPASATSVINLNGHTLETTGTGAVIENEGNLVITGAGEVVAEGNVIRNLNGNVVIEDGTFISDSSVVYGDAGTVTIKGGEFELNTPVGYENAIIDVAFGGEVVIEDGTFIANSENTRIFGVYEGTKLVINGGHFVAYNDDPAHDSDITASSPGASFEINGGVFDCYITAWVADECVINGGTFNKTITATDSTIVVNDGEFTVASKPFHFENLANTPIPQVIINGGTFAADQADLYTINGTVLPDHVIVNGGTFNA